jgi:hypothetical protein
VRRSEHGERRARATGGSGSCPCAPWSVEDPTARVREALWKRRAVRGWKRRGPHVAWAKPGAATAMSVLPAAGRPPRMKDVGVLDRIVGRARPHRRYLRRATLTRLVVSVGPDSSIVRTATVSLSNHEPRPRVLPSPLASFGIPSAVPQGATGSDRETLATRHPRLFQLRRLVTQYAWPWLSGATLRRHHCIQTPPKDRVQLVDAERSVVRSRRERGRVH